mmetsp:Transcript_50645/g.80299  ORF Transcript_50645/g.80299 Transcript_50645/m.80299 type:complete len:229 (-) Transcript_50645:571-1257(-)
MRGNELSRYSEMSCCFQAVRPSSHICKSASSLTSSPRLPRLLKLISLFSLERLMHPRRQTRGEFGSSESPPAQSDPKTVDKTRRDIPCVVQRLSSTRRLANLTRSFRRSSISVDFLLVRSYNTTAPAHNSPEDARRQKLKDPLPRTGFDIIFSRILARHSANKRRHARRRRCRSANLSFAKCRPRHPRHHLCRIRTACHCRSLICRNRVCRKRHCRKRNTQRPLENFM